MSDIFLCYASEDRKRLRLLVEALTQEGWSVSWDRTIPVGKTWQEVLEELLGTVRSLLVVWSRNSINRKWVIEEAEEGIRKRLPLFPVLLDRVLPPVRFRSLQSVNLSAWDGATSSFAFQGLVRNIRRTLGQPAELELPRLTPQVIPQPDLSEPPSAEKFSNSLDMHFVLIPAGTFMMGSGIEQEGDEDEQPQHQVTLSRPFYVQTTPVTQGQWHQVMGENPSFFRECGEDCPVENVSWDEVQEFIEKLNRMEGTDQYRLPTEAEWEYACRAGSTTSFCFGDDVAKLEKYAWYEENSEKSTHPVGFLKANPWGLHDMHGNVYEWCQDWYGQYPPGPVTDPEGPSSGEYRVLRGGSWNGDADDLRSAYRLRFSPGYRYNHIGFRVAKDL
jgi:formylglycine-generating enzyme required for sulfatase activity